jgi:hypothetical protein
METSTPRSTEASTHFPLFAEVIKTAVTIPLDKIQLKFDFCE